MKFCPSCGAKKLREQDRFCMNCGEPYPVLADVDVDAANAPAQAPVETVAPATPAPEAKLAQAESLFDAPARTTPPAGESPAAPVGAANVQPSKLAASAESARASSYAPVQPSAAFSQPAATPEPAAVPQPPVPATEGPVLPPEPAVVPPSAPAPEPVVPAAQPPVQQQPTAPPAGQPAAMPENLFDNPAPDTFAPAPPVAEEVEAEAASLRDSIDKMLGDEAPAQVYQPAGQPENLFETGYEETAPAAPQTPFAANVFDEVEEEPTYQAAVFDEEVQYDEYGNPIAAYGEETLLEEGAEGYAGQQGYTEGGDTLGFGAVADDGSLFDEPGQSDTLFASAPAPKQQHSQPQQREVPRRQRVDDLSQAVESATGPDTEKWQRLQQDDNLQDLYAREERKRKPPEIPLPEYSEKKPKKRGGGGGTGRTVGIIITAVIVFVIGTLGATMGLLYYRNSPGKAIDAFIEDIEALNYTGLNGQVELIGVEGTTDGWKAFCDSFESASAKRDLQNQLKTQAKKGATASDEYPAVVMESEKLFLFVNRYYITIQGIDLLAEGIYEVDGSTINGLFMKGEESEQGRIFRGLMPGRYNYEIYYSGQELIGEIDAFATESANKLTAGGETPANTDAETATVTVSNCISDDATLYVANNPVEAKPSGGVVTIENVALGNEIRIEANVDGEIQVARVAFNDVNETNLAFGEYTAQTAEAPAEEPASSEADAGGNEALARAQAMTASDINSVLGTYYQSYLTSINDQTTNTLKNSTGKNSTAMAERITATNNASNTFEYLGVNVDSSSIVASEENGVPKLTFTASFTYRYTPREEGAETQDGGNTQNVTMIYEDGEWRVDSMAHVTE